MALAEYNAAALALSGISNYWPLSEASGTSFADSQASNTAVASTAPGRVTGPDGAAQAPDFAATSGKVLLPGSAVSLPTTHTVFYWIKLNSQGAADAMAFEWATAAFAKYCQHCIGSTTNYIGGGGTGQAAFAAFYAGVGGATSKHTPRTDFPNGTWKFVCVTMDPTNAGLGVNELKLFIDGVETGIVTGSTNFEQSGSAGSGTVGIGGRGQGGRGLPLDGAMQGLGITSAVLTTTQMDSLRLAMVPTTASKSGSDSATGSDSSAVTVTFQAKSGADSGGVPQSSAGDSFTDTNGTLLESHTPTGVNGSGAWTKHSAASTDGLAIDGTNGRLRGPSGAGTAGTNGFYTHSLAPSSQDYEVSADVVILDNTPGDLKFAGVLGRWDPAASLGTVSGFWAFYDPGDNGLGASPGKIRLWRFGGAGTAEIGSYASGDLTGSHTIRLSMVGTAIKVYLDGTERISVTESTVAGVAGSRGGVRLGYKPNGATSTGVHLDNFVVTGPDVSGESSSLSITSSDVSKSGTDTGTGTDASAITAKIDPSTGAATGTSQSGAAQTVIAGSGASDSLNYNAFPGLCRAPNGDLIAAWHHANDHTGTATNKLYVSVGVSNGLGGYTWGTPATLRTTSGVNVADVGCLTLADGQVLVTWNEASTPGHANVNTVVNYCRAYSSDNGQTFGTVQTGAVPGWATTVTAGSPGGAYAIAPNPPIQLANGDLLVASYGWDDRAIEDGGGSFSSREYVKCCKSTDSGATWSVVGTIFPDTVGTAYDETDLLLLDNGHVLAAVRTIEGSGTGYTIWTAKSTDSGVTWGSKVRALGNSTTTGWGGRPSLIQAANTGVLIRTRYMSAGVSSFPGYRLSTDRGATWSANETDPYDGTVNHTGAVANPRGADVYGAWAPTGTPNVVAHIWAEDIGALSAAIYFRTVTITGTTSQATDTGAGTESAFISTGTVSVSGTDAGAGTETASVTVDPSSPVPTPVPPPPLSEVITASHTAAVLVEVLEDGEVVDELDTVIDGTVTLDQTAASRGRCDIALVDDGSLGLVPNDAGDLLAPYGNELRISRGVIHTDLAVEYVRLGVFRIETATVDDTPGSLLIRIAGLDRSARIIDARFEEPYQVVAGTNYTTAIEDVIAAAYPDVVTDLTATSRTAPQLIAQEGDDRWAFAQDMARAIGMTLYFDGDGTLVLRPVSAAGQTPVAVLAEGEDGLLVQASRAWTRQGAFNRVIATGENTGLAAPARGVATDDNPLSPTYYYGDFGKVPRFYASPFITTDEQAADAAQAILARELGTTESVDFGSIVNPALKPDDVVSILRERAGIDEDHIIDSVTIPLTVEGGMTGKTRATQVNAGTVGS